MLKLFSAAIVAAALVLPVSQAEAGSRYATPPSLSVGTSVSSPWMLQLKPKRRAVSRREMNRLKRLRARRHGQTRLQRLRATAPARQRSRQLFGTRRATPPPTHTASVRRNSGALRSSITPNFRADLLPTVVDYPSSDEPGTIIVNTPERRLYVVMEGGKARRYAIGVGKPGFEWRGTHRVSRKAEWPDWRPPASMIAREKKKGRILPKFMAGGPDNPLGARALYLGSSIYRIHGTNQDWSIGKAVSSGCIRMRNEDVMDLYERIPIGTRVRVI